jgi:hypothetical protein
MSATLKTYPAGPEVLADMAMIFLQLAAPAMVTATAVCNAPAPLASDHCLYRLEDLKTPPSTDPLVMTDKN